MNVLKSQCQGVATLRVCFFGYGFLSRAPEDGWPLVSKLRATSEGSRNSY